MSRVYRFTDILFDKWERDK